MFHIRTMPKQGWFLPLRISFFHRPEEREIGIFQVLIPAQKHSNPDIVFFIVKDYLPAGAGIF